LYLLDASGKAAEVEARVADPRWTAAVTPSLEADLAFARHRWGQWLAWLWPASYLRGSPASWFLAALSAVLWGWFCWRLGGSPRLLVVAFLLGVLSIYPTHVLIHLEEVIPALRQTGDLVGDAVYFVLGVGLREEAAKLLCFLPLLLALRRGTARGEGLVLGAVVGLGFAAVENVSYFEGGSLATTLTRFLTANFLHISLTAVAAETVTEAIRVTSDRSVARAVNTFGLVVLLHGAYDWFLSTPQLGELSFLAMTTFVICSQLFLRAAPVGRGRGGMPLVRVVILALVILAGASFVYGSAVAGPGAAAVSLAQGLLGVVVILVMFHRELGPAR
jgi:RsiW-degrading membrane proteinase PrsW (M82 family)